MHDVATELRMNGEQFFSQERETIVFKRQGLTHTTKTRPVAGLSRTFVRYAGRAAAPLANVIGADHE